MSGVESATAQATKKRKRRSSKSPTRAEGAAAAGAAAAAAAPPVLTWPFAVDYNDHFETSARALRDVAPFLSAVARTLGKDKASLRIYDPFYCAGSVVRHLGALGFATVINRCVDFYVDVTEGTVPEHDVLLTNPPYSGSHKERCLAFAAASGKPWALLLPNYVSTKRYFVDAVGGAPPFFVVPSSPYEYEHPEGTGKAQPPFESMWYLHGGSAAATTRLRDELHGGVAAAAAATPRPMAAAAPRPVAAAAVVHSVEELAAAGAVAVSRRPNPRQRKKLRALMAAKAASGGGGGGRAGPLR